ncbi:MAG: YdeI/OmpD-associated family protein [Planctomycetota bacterium]
MTPVPNPKVDAFIHRNATWADILTKSRAALLACGLDEEIKWGKPCYSSGGKNIAILQPFKNLCALMFFEGMRLDDPKGLLQIQGPNSQSAKRLEYTQASQVSKAAIQGLVKQALALSETPAKANPKASADLPPELQAALGRNPKLAKAFAALTPGRQRGHALHIGSAKQSATRLRRIEAVTQMILAGKGFDGR